MNVGIVSRTYQLGPGYRSGQRSSEEKVDQGGPTQHAGFDPVRLFGLTP